MANLFNTYQRGGPSVKSIDVFYDSISKYFHNVILLSEVLLIQLTFIVYSY